MSWVTKTRPKSSAPRTAARIALGTALAGFGGAHLTVARRAFPAQVPERLVKALSVSTDDIVLGSGPVEIAPSAAVAGLPRDRLRVGAAAAAYFVAIFPGNVSQLLRHADDFGLDSTRKRVVRLAFQPALVAWSLYAGGAL